MADYTMIRDKNNKIIGMWIKELASNPMELYFMVFIGSGFQNDEETKKICNKLLEGTYTIKDNNLNNDGGYIILF